MRSAITPNSIANGVKMQRSLHKGAFLIVEGDTDAYVFDRLVDRSSCFIVIAYGKENVLGAIDILKDDGFRGAVAVVDADYWHLDGFAPPDDSVLVTDTHDMETMMLECSAFDRVVETLRTMVPEASRDLEAWSRIRSVLLAAGMPVGYLRWASGASGWNLQFEGLPLESVFDSTGYSVTLDDLAELAKRHSGKHSLGSQVIIQEVKRLEDPAHSPWQVCCGHDLTYVLAILMCTWVGETGTMDYWRNKVERLLRREYGVPEFVNSSLCARIAIWEGSHSPYKVAESSIRGHGM